MRFYNNNKDILIITTFRTKQKFFFIGDNFLSPIPVSDWLNFCCGNSILIMKKGNANDKNTFLMKNNNNKNTKEVYVNIK